MKQGYGVFGAAYEVMLRNDPHDPRSIDHELLRRMVRLDPESYDLLYAEPPFCPHMEGHDLYGLAQTLKKQEDRASIETILAFTSGIAKKCETSLEKKRFGGTGDPGPRYRLVHGHGPRGGRSFGMYRYSCQSSLSR